MNPPSEINFSVTCWPGRRAMSAAREVLPGQWALTLFLEPVSVVISQAPCPDGAFELAQWCRELSRETAKLAVELDPAGGPTAPVAGDGAW